MKNSENKMLDQLLKDRLAEGSANVPNFVWDNIEEELFPEKKRRGFFWWFFGGVCLMFLGVIAWFFNENAAHLKNVEHHKNQSAQHQSFHQKTSDPKIGIYRKSVVPKKSKPGSKTLIKSYQNNLPGKKPVSMGSVNSFSKDVSSASVHKTSSKSKTDRSSKALNANSGKNDHYSSGQNTFETNKTISSSSQPSANKTTDQPEAVKETEKTPEITEAKTETDSVGFAQILEMLQKKYPFKDVPKELSKFSIGIYGGPSFYDIAVFKDYFISGQLSHRTFTSSGFETGFNARFNLGNRFTIYSGLAFNQKQTQFNYNLAITQTDYFTNVVNGNKIPLANIVDNGVNSCFLAKGVMAKYTVSSTLFSLGTTYQFWKSGRFSAAADLRFSFNTQSAMKLSEMTVLDIQQPESERFSYFQPGLGVLLNVQLNNRFSVGLAPVFSKQFYLKESFTKKVNELVVPVTMSFRF